MRLPLASPWLAKCRTIQNWNCPLLATSAIPGGADAGLGSYPGASGEDSISGGWRPGDGQFYYNYVSGAGARTDGADVSAGVIGVLLDFDSWTCTIYRDGVVDWVESMDVADDTVLHPCAGLYESTSLELQTVEPFLILSCPLIISASGRPRVPAGFLLAPLERKRPRTEADGSPVYAPASATLEHSSRDGRTVLACLARIAHLSSQSRLMCWGLLLLCRCSGVDPGW